MICLSNFLSIKVWDFMKPQAYCFLGFAELDANTGFDSGDMQFLC